MADTGAPWNIPFAEPSDLVRDWPALSSAVGTAVAAGLTQANIAIGPNVVQTVKTNTFTTTSATFTDVDGLTATITPSSETSKILVIAYIPAMGTEGSNQGFHVRLSGGNATNFVGNASGSRVRTAFGSASFITNIQFNLYPVTLSFLDAPATTSATTYSVQVRRGAGGTVFVNRTESNLDSAVSPAAASSITVIEVAA
jgi:hypothetical protein